MFRPASKWFAGFAVAVALLTHATANAQSYRSNQVVVKFSSGATVSCRDSSVLLVSGTVIDSVGTTPQTYVVQLPDTSVKAAVATLVGRACVEFAEPNYTDFELLISAPNDSLFFRSWWLSNTGSPYGATPGADIGALKGWDYVKESPDVIVAIMDKGIAITRPDIVDDIFTNWPEVSGSVGLDMDGNGYPHDVHGWDFFNDDYTIEDDLGHDPHGTMVASVFGATGNNTIGMTGVTWSSQILPVKIIQFNGSYDEIVDASTIAKAFHYAVDMGAKIINCSWRAFLSSPLYDAVTYAKDHGVLVVAAAGNDGRSNDDWGPLYCPASLPQDNVLAVAFSDRTDSLDVPGGRACYTSTQYSNYGPTTVDVAAPGCDICGDFPDYWSCGHSGTSLSAPIVSAEAALLWQQNPTWTYTDVKNRIMVTVDTLSSAKYRLLGKGRVDIGRALDNVKPSAISDLTVVYAGNYSSSLSWTDTGDDTTYGQASKYHFKYRTGGAITNETQYASASDVPMNLGAPGTSGTYHCVVVTGLSSCTTYGWALKLEDPEFNVSNLSNSASATTRCVTPLTIADCGGDGLMAGGGDGGGDFSVERLTPEVVGVGAASHVTLQPASADYGWRAENSLRIGDDAAATDLLEMKSTRAGLDGTYRVRLAPIGERSIHLSDASLAVVDHAPGATVVVASSKIYLGTSGGITRASVKGAVRTSVYQSGEGAVSEPGETIDLEFPTAGRTLLTVELEARAQETESASGTVDVQARDTHGEWTTVASISPRRGLDRVAVDVTGAAGVRLRVGRRTFIRSIATLTGASEATPAWLTLSSAQLSGGGRAEAGRIDLGPGEHAALAFAGTAQEPGTERAVFLRTTSRSESSTRGAANDNGTPEVAFSLTMRPNPAAGRVAVDFTMAHEMNVKIRMYDAAGRLVRTLADGLETAGSHSVVWDGRNDSGASVHGGLYFCRMEVGSWVSMKKMVFLAQR